MKYLSLIGIISTLLFSTSVLADPSVKPKDFITVKYDLVYLDSKCSSDVMQLVKAGKLVANFDMTNAPSAPQLNGNVILTNFLGSSKALKATLNNEGLSDKLGFISNLNLYPVITIGDTSFELKNITLVSQTSNSDYVSYLTIDGTCSLKGHQIS